jgi:RNA polymerase sigma factor (sigma-70 family)
MRVPIPLESTVVLLDRIRAGDDVARARLMERYLPILRAWAHGRLPVRARGMAETDDLVQVTMLRALTGLKAFEYRHDGAFLAYLRQSVLNGVREELRRTARRPSTPESGDEQFDSAPPVIEQVIGREILERYESALMRLRDEEREAAILRLEFGLSYPEIAEAMAKPSANAARMYVVRAFSKLAEWLDDSAG